MANADINNKFKNMFNKCLLGELSSLVVILYIHAVLLHHIILPRLCFAENFSDITRVKGIACTLSIFICLFFVFYVETTSEEEQ